MSEPQTTSKTTNTIEDLSGLRCPKCDYELTGLKQNRCPECGERFEVDALCEAQVNLPERSGPLARHARSVRNVSTANLLHQLLCGLLIDTEHRLVGLAPFFSACAGFIRSVGFTLGPLVAVITMALGFGIIVRAGVMYYVRASLIGLATVLVSVLTAFVWLWNIDSR